MLRKKVPVVLQFSDTECGVASLAMIFSFYKKPVSLEKLREKCGVSRDGCRANTLIKVANDYGFKAAGYKVDIDEIKDHPRPLIAYWNFNHYVVIAGISDTHVKVNDPAYGRRWVSKEEFNKSFTGVVIDVMVRDNNIISNRVEQERILKNLIVEFKSEFGFLFIALLVLGIVSYLDSALSRVLVDQIIINKFGAWFSSLFALTTLLGIIAITATRIFRFSQFKLYSKASLKKSSQILERVLKLPIIFYSLRQKSEIISLFTRFEAAINVAFKGVVVILCGILSGIICLILMLSMDKILTILSLFVTAGYIFILNSLLHHSEEIKKSNLMVGGKLDTFSIATIRNIETVKTSGMEKEIFNRWHHLFSKKLHYQSRIGVADLIQNEVNNFYYFFISLSLFIFGSYRVSIGELTIGSLLSYYALNLIFASQMLKMSQVVKEFQSVLITNARVEDIYRYGLDTRFLERPANLPQSDSSFTIKLDNVTFFYNVHTLPTLNLISLTVKPGEHIAFVGDTGSGKSTLAKLIAGFYQPQTGCIDLLGRNMSSYSASDLSNTCAYVSQEVSLFSGTILQNITLNRSCPANLIELAVLTAELQALVDERGLSGTVEECGQNFSGGEKQRIDLARAIAQNTPLLILDEATSALDSETEEKVIANLKKLSKTVIFVAHRLSSITHCDQIYVLKEGMIVEKGTHEELMAMRSAYFLLVNNEIKSDSLC